MKRYYLVFLIPLLITGCTRKRESPKRIDQEDKFEVLISYIEKHHDFINSPESPAAMNAEEVYQKLHENIHIIDVRSAEEYRKGRVPGAVNVPISEIIHYFEEVIDPSSFDMIFLFSKDHQESMFANGVLRMLGYTNTFNIRWGMAGWNSAYASEAWEEALSDDLANLLTTKGYPKNEPGDYPVIRSAYSQGFDILRERSQKLLSVDYRELLITAKEVVSAPEKYYLINYWPMKDYKTGHLPNAVQYDQRTSLKREAYLNTLPTDRTIVLYCYSNSTTPVVAAYLHILGYDVKTIAYGTNGFMYNELIERIGKSFFSKRVVNDFPIETDEGVIGEPNQEEIKFVAPEGGC